MSPATTQLMSAPPVCGSLATSRNAQFGHGEQIEHLREILPLEHPLFHHQLPHRDVLRHCLFSELRGLVITDLRGECGDERGALLEPVLALRRVRLDALDAPLGEHAGGIREEQHGRSEEHTSELQSQSNLVCRLLLEKKK